MNIDPLLLLVLIVIVGGGLSLTLLERTYWKQRRHRAIEHNDKQQSAMPGNTRAYRVRLKPGEQPQNLYLSGGQLLIEQGGTQTFQASADTISRILYDRNSLLIELSNGSSQILYNLYGPAQESDDGLLYDNSLRRDYNDPNYLAQFIQDLQAMGVTVEKGKTGASKSTRIIGIVCLAFIGLLILAMIIGAIVDATN